MGNYPPLPDLRRDKFKPHSGRRQPNTLDVNCRKALGNAAIPAWAAFKLGRVPTTANSHLLVNFAPLFVGTS